jgi:hypothetical protein
MRMAGQVLFFYAIQQELENPLARDFLAGQGFSFRVVGDSDGVSRSHPV